MQSFQVRAAQGVGRSRDLIVSYFSDVERLVALWHANRFHFDDIRRSLNNKSELTEGESSVQVQARFYVPSWLTPQISHRADARRRAGAQVHYWESG